MESKDCPHGMTGSLLVAIWGLATNASRATVVNMKNLFALINIACSVVLFFSTHILSLVPSAHAEDNCDQLDGSGGPYTCTLPPQFAGNSMITVTIVASRITVAPIFTRIERETITTIYNKPAPGAATPTPGATETPAAETPTPAATETPAPQNTPNPADYTQFVSKTTQKVISSFKNGIENGNMVNYSSVTTTESTYTNPNNPDEISTWDYAVRTKSSVKTPPVNGNCYQLEFEDSYLYKSVTNLAVPTFLSGRTVKEHIDQETGKTVRETEVYDGTEETTKSREERDTTPVECPE